MDTFAREDPDIRAEVFRETAARMAIGPAIIEKDFWVCWILKRVFSLDGPIPEMTLKGGTSLSKAYGAIRRFSEDIDLSLNREQLGFAGDRDPATVHLSGNARERILDQLEVAAVEAVAGPVKDALTASVRAALGSKAVIVVDEHMPQTLLFTYPQSLDAKEKSAYVRSAVRLEFGARPDHLPAERKIIAPYIHTEFPGLIGDPKITVKTLAAERTFWEKATILHMLFHQDPAKRLDDRMSRHYYDFVQIARSRTKENALGNLDLLVAVADHKSIFYRAAWAKYREARPPTLKLSPGPPLERALRADYARMAEMLFDEPEPFDDLLKSIAELESEINALEASYETEKRLIERED